MWLFVGKTSPEGCCFAQSSVCGARGRGEMEAGTSRGSVPAGTRGVERSGQELAHSPGGLGPLSLACSCRVPVGPLCVCLSWPFLIRTWSVLGSNPVTSFHPPYPFTGTICKRNTAAN